MMDASSSTPREIRRPSRNYLGQAWLVLLLTICFGSALAGVELTLAPAIEANKINETREKVPELIWGAKAAKLAEQHRSAIDGPIVVAADIGNYKKQFNVYRATDQGNLAGWVAKASGQGYAGVIELLIGLDARADNITGVFVLDQKETPGLGSRIAEVAWRDQFNNVATDRPLTVVKKSGGFPGEIDAIAGATISSKAVCRIINQAISQLKKPLAQQAKTDSGKQDG